MAKQKIIPKTETGHHAYSVYVDYLGWIIRGDDGLWPLQCRACNVKFRSKRFDRLTCSPSCRKAYSRHIEKMNNETIN
jgi:hypothetical protein